MSAALPGKGWRALYENLESTVQQMMKLAGASAQRQAANIMLGKARDPYTARYINAMAKSTNRTCAKFAVIPDIDAKAVGKGVNIKDSKAPCSSLVEVAR